MKLVPAIHPVDDVADGGRGHLWIAFGEQVGALMLVAETLLG